MVTVPGVIVIQVAKNTLPQSLLMPGSSSKNNEPSDRPENNNILITLMLDLITYPINIMIQRKNKNNSLIDNTLGNFGLKSFQNQTVNEERSTPTTICCKFTEPEITIQNVNKKTNEINDFLLKTNLPF